MNNIWNGRYLPWTAGGGVLHDHNFGDVTEFAEIFPQSLGARLPTQTADEHFPAPKPNEKSINKKPNKKKTSKHFHKLRLRVHSSAPPPSLHFLDFFRVKKVTISPAIDFDKQQKRLSPRIELPSFTSSSVPQDANAWGKHPSASALFHIFTSFSSHFPHWFPSNYQKSVEIHFSDIFMSFLCRFQSFSWHYYVIFLTDFLPTTKNRSKFNFPTFSCHFLVILLPDFL